MKEDKIQELSKLVQEYELKIKRLKEIEEELSRLDISGYEKPAERLRKKLKDPNKSSCFVFP